MVSLLKRSASLLWLVPYAIVFLSILYGVIQHTAGAVINNNFMPKGDKLTSGSTYLLIGAWVGLGVIYVTGEVILTKRRRDGYDDKQLHLLEGKMLFLTITAGMASSMYTLAGIIGALHFDAGITSAVASGFILLTVIYEWFGGGTRLKTVLLPGLISVICTVMIAYRGSWSESHSLQNDLGKLALYALGYNILKAYENVMTTRVLRHRSYNKVHFQRIRFTSLAVMATVMVLFSAGLRGLLPELAESIKFFLFQPLLYVLLLIVFVCVALQQITEYEAKEKMELDLSKISITLSLAVGLNFLVALVMDSIDQGIVGAVETSGGPLLIRLLGVIGLMGTLFLLKETKKHIDQEKVN